jgi:hypothetical protein
VVWTWWTRRGDVRAGELGLRKEGLKPASDGK